MQKKKHKIEQYKNTRITWFNLMVNVHGRNQATSLIYESVVQILCYMNHNIGICGSLNPKLIKRLGLPTNRIGLGPILMS